MTYEDVTPFTFTPIYTVEEEMGKMASLKEKIRVASGEGMAELLIKNGRVVDVFSGQIEKKDVAIFGEG